MCSDCYLVLVVAGMYVDCVCVCVCFSRFYTFFVVAAAWTVACSLARSLQHIYAC